VEGERVGAAHELDLPLLLALTEGAYPGEDLGRVGVLRVASGAEAVGDKGAHRAVEDERAVTPHVVHEHGVWRLALGPGQPAHPHLAGDLALARARLLKLGSEDDHLGLVVGGRDGNEERPLALGPRTLAERAEEVLDARAGLGDPHGRVSMIELGHEPVQARRV
jgi:hypothetical protein